MLVNVTINENNIITGWTKIPFSYDKAIINLQDNQKIYVGFSKAINPRIEILKTIKTIDEYYDFETEEVKYRTIEEEHQYTCYDFIENKELYIQNQQSKLQSMKETQYKNLVEKLIREKYSISDEISIIRQEDTKPEEYQEYYEYAEQCKIKAKGI